MSQNPLDNTVRQTSSCPFADEVTEAWRGEETYPCYTKSEHLEAGVASELAPAGIAQFLNGLS